MGCVDRGWQCRPNGFPLHDISTRQPKPEHDTREFDLNPHHLSPQTHLRYWQHLMVTHFPQNWETREDHCFGVPFPLLPSECYAWPDLSWVHNGNMSHLPRAGSHMVQTETLCWRFAGFSIVQDGAGINIASKAETKTIEKETRLQLRQLRRPTKTQKEERKTKRRLTISKTSTTRRELPQIRAIVDVKVSTERINNIRYCHIWRVFVICKDKEKKNNRDWMKA